MKKKTYQRKQVPTKLKKELLLILQQARGTMIKVTGVGIDVWDFLEKPRTEQEILDHIVSLFDVEIETAEQDIKNFLLRLSQEDLLQ